MFQNVFTPTLRKLIAGCVHVRRLNNLPRVIDPLILTSTITGEKPEVILDLLGMTLLGKQLKAEVQEGDRV